MEFSLGGTGNPLQNYLNNNHGQNKNSDSIRSIADLETLDAYFKQKRIVINSNIDRLWTRIEQCEARCQQFSSDIDLSYSRINNEPSDNSNSQRNGLNIQRYSDLLAVSFKEVEWAKSSRVNVVEDEEKIKVVEKYEKLIENYEKRLKDTQKEQIKMFTQTEGMFLDEISQYNRVITQKHAQYNRIFTSLQDQLQDIATIFEGDHNNLNQNLQHSYASLAELLSARIGEIDRQLSLLSQ